MNSCISPPPPEPAALLRAVSGEGDPATTAHLAACPACLARAEALAQVERRLGGALFRAGCPSPEELAALAEGDLEPARQPVLVRHVAICPLCQRDQAEYMAFMTLPDRIPDAAMAPSAARLSTPPPATRLSDLIAGLRVRVAQAVGGAGGFGGLTPALAGAAAGGLRGAAGEAVFAVDTEGVRITLKSETDEERRGRRILSGTLSSPAWEGATAWLAADDRVVAGTTVEARGFFELTGLAPGRYTLTLCLADTAVQVPAFEL